jgi:GDP-4-dehydro-6-deoxy-D-mannose reductase
MKAFVTGARGFAGRALVTHLRDDIGDDVVGTDRGGDAPTDIVDREAIQKAIARAQPDVVYHLAAFTHVGESFEQPALVRRVNIDGTANVLDGCLAAGVGRVLVVGSAEEYGAARPDELPLREDAPLRPTSPYAVSKIAASYLALQAWLSHGLEVLRVRAFNHTGPGQLPQFLVPALAQRIAAAERNGGTHVTIGATDPVRDLNDVRDVVRAYRLVAEHGAPGEVYNVCSGTAVSVAEIAERLLARARRPLSLVTDPALVRAVEVPALIGDPSKLRAATGWEPQYTLDQTLTDVLEDARRRVPQPPI